MNASPTIVLTHWELRLSEDDLALLLLDVKGSDENRISSVVWEELWAVLEKIEALPQIKGLVLASGKKEDFCGGEDLNEILALKDAAQAEIFTRRIQDILSRFEALPFPTLAALKGRVIGAGMDLAAACAVRVAAEQEETFFQLPQVPLGFCPAFGATVRLPHLIGLAPAGEMILSGEAVGAERACALGLVDLLSPPEKLFEESLQLLRRVLQGDVAVLHEPRIELSRQDYLAENSALYRRYWRMQFLSRYLSNCSGYERPIQETFEAILEGWTKPEGPALEKAAKVFSGLIVTPEASALIAQSFETERARQRRLSSAEGRKVNRVGILGGGRLGGELAWGFSSHKIPVWLKDVEDEAVLQSLRTARGIYEEHREEERISPGEFAVGLSRITAGLSYDGFKRLDLVVENVVEDFEIKKHVLMEAEKTIAPETVILSNTASLSVNRLSGFLQRPERFAGLQFFRPFAKRPLVEIIKAKDTAESTMAAIAAFARRLGKIPVVVKDAPGFVVNRLMVSAVNEALFWLTEGFAPQRIDAAAERFGFALSPLRTADEMGLKTVFRINEDLRGTSGRPETPLLLKELLEDGVTGCASRAGFYLYEEGKIFSNDPALRRVIGKRKGNLAKVKTADEMIAEGLVLAMLNEACAVLHEGVVDHPREVDTALILGAGFAPFRGGLLHYAESCGLPAVLERMSLLGRETGRTLEPHPLLLEMAQHNAQFFGR